jgi:hypothetical protein
MKFEMKLKVEYYKVCNRTASFVYFQLENIEDSTKEVNKSKILTKKLKETRNFYDLKKQKHIVTVKT